ncbi:hypothetical protein [Phormidium sp. FACHB-1136]|uniref:hypothetical protein n=1 Tax=Phormidium sp. FACHB-1136 TaxID=2692848 RepID=UPI001685D465|nr:hypothetical protein [Phormidium sp. FACHB-1136]MBD2425252.1 hypothetical protein [Phormidium sp. FACHB-1136]
MQLNLLDLIAEAEAQARDAADDAVLAEIEARGLSVGQGLVARAHARNALAKARCMPRGAQEYFLSLIVEGLTND